ncbi:DEAD/DEAH box helicase [Corynebacterium caspium]|uniref:DEAD/DEAH box helicase n=1 Tax=Corynebacterium caspium TaxID=234828 RepID=UPI0004760C7B|nr:DEAD/DEAH box helicase [Corynebacterium caspium]
MKGTLRAWQAQALAKYLLRKPKDFLAVATPGAGKTTFALRVATELLDKRRVDRVIVVVPTEHLKLQWSQAAARIGISLDPKFKNTDAVNPSYDGVVVTYAQVALAPHKHYAVSTAKRSLVILDEIHHGGDARSWGDGIREAYDSAEHRLSLTGTPFRSDDSQIPFVQYTDDGEGHLISQADHTYGYADALADGVVRPVVFLAYSGEARWRDSAGEEYAARLGEPLNAEETTRAWRTALDPKGQWIPEVLQAAHKRLLQIRKNMPDAGGLVIASDTKTARAYARILGRISNNPVTVVLSDEAGASDRIEEFSQSTSEWMVAVRMVSEGVDVPRLMVGVYATAASTPLFFAQAIGRFVRSRMPGEMASIFLPSVPVLLDLAAKLEKSRDHVLGKPHRESEGFEEALLADANREKNEPDEVASYISIGANAELDSVIYEGSTYGTGTVAGSAEEADYLGLPGLLDAEQMRILLKQREKAQLDARSQAAAKASANPINRPVSPPRAGQIEAASVTTTASRIASEEIPELRKNLNAIVASIAASTGRPHGAIHTEARKACGGPPTALCSAEQLRQRIDYLRKW